jgi:pilus assembly protein Flp/PilA
VVTPRRAIGVRAPSRNPAAYTAGLNTRKEHFMWFARIKRFIASDDGPTAVEYAVMLALIIIVCLVSIQTLGSNTKTQFNNIATSLGS